MSPYYVQGTRYNIKGIKYNIQPDKSNSGNKPIKLISLEIQKAFNEIESILAFDAKLTNYGI